MTVFHLVLDGEAFDITDLAIGDMDTVQEPSFHIYSSSLLEGRWEEELVSGLKEKASRMVDHYVQEKRYTVRLLLSSLVFLAVYFVGTFAVRDPFPIIDEMIIALAVSTLFWRYMKKRDTRQMKAVDYKNKLLKAIDGAVEEESPLLRAVESFYSELRMLSPVEMAHMIVSGVRRFSFPGGEDGDHRLFLRLFFLYMEKEEKSLAADFHDICKGAVRPDLMEKRLLKAYGTGRYDIYLLALCLAF